MAGSPWTSRSAPDVERRLGKWLIRQRRAHHGGTLLEAQVHALDRLDDWTIPERQRNNEEHWHNQLTALAAFVHEHGRMPRYQRYTSEHEHRLGVWLHVQHQNRTLGKLQATRQESLDAAAPGWRSHE